MKKLLKGKKSRYVLLLLISVFLTWNIVWGINYYGYYKYSTGYEKSPINYFKSEKDYTYTVDGPSYLRLTGNFAITNNDDLSIIIWPSLFMRSAEYGISIEDKKKNATYRFYVDEGLKYFSHKDMNYTQSEENYIKSLLDKNKEELSKMQQLAAREWMTF